MTTIPLPALAQAMQQRLAEKLKPTAVAVVDERAAPTGQAGASGTGFGTHVRVRIASPMFTERSRVAQHRLVYDALQEFIDQGVHAIVIEVL